MSALRMLLATLALALGLTAPAHAIVGGKDASPTQFPYVAHVLIDRAAQCTGTLVTPDHVITAAHCSSLVPGGVANVPIGQPGQLIEVSIGAHRTPSATLTSYDTDGERRTARAVAVNPGWLGLGSVSHDVAVLTLDRPSTKPPVKIAAAEEHGLWAPGTLATIAGFGVTESGGDSPDVLQYAQVPIVEDGVAAKAYPYLVRGVDPVFGGFENRTQVAAGYAKGGVDTCQGDSGGPLLVPAGTDFRLVGDTSYGYGCAEPGYPGVYGRLAGDSLREWVRSVAPGAIAPPPASGDGTTTTKKGGPKRTKGVKRASARRSGKRYERRRAHAATASRTLR